MVGVGSDDVVGAVEGFGTVDVVGAVEGFGTVDVVGVVEVVGAVDGFVVPDVLPGPPDVSLLPEDVGFVEDAPGVGDT